jgi:hypothetical protein
MYLFLSISVSIAKMAVLRRRTSFFQRRLLEESVETGNDEPDTEFVLLTVKAFPC